MDAFTPPLSDIATAFDLVGLDELLALEPFAHVERGVVDELLAEFGRLAAGVIAPTDREGDQVGSRLDIGSGAVTTPPSVRPAYQAIVDGGWNAPGADLEFGGGGLPAVVAVAVQEMLTSANMALSLCPMLTQTAAELLSARGDERQRTVFLPRLVSGEWTGTMNLTEPDAGSDVGAVRTRAERDEQGNWRVTGTKIFITWGEHDLADNIVHFVLARTPGAAPGTKGLSLFLVPKVLVGDDGSLGEANGVRCVKLEEKVGIHLSPTCVLEYDGALAELVGEEAEGMAGMFTMMNAARRAVAIQGLAVGERALQQAERYAAERVQGAAVDAPAGARSPIAEHPDVRRMLLTMRALVVGMRHLVYATAYAADVARAHPDGATRERADARLNLLTPIAKAWCTDTGVAVSSLAVQVFGGMGYIEEAGVAQRWRDSRIAPIYEGTNGIQAIDLVTRKVRRDKGEAMSSLLDEIGATVAQLEEAGGGLAPCAELLRASAATLQEATDWMLARAPEEQADVLAGATSYLELCGLVVAGWMHARAALAPDASASTVALCTFYATEVLPRATGLLVPVTAGAARLAAL